MQITHEEARTLIQFNADRPLDGIAKERLEDHLASCLECRSHAVKIQEVETTLAAVMKRRWANQPLVRSTQVVGSRKQSKFTQDVVFATRMVAMGVICIAFLFNIWQFTQSAGSGSNPTSASIPPVPTPSLYSTTTHVITDECGQLLYTVQENDTLAVIAQKFSVSMEEIVLFNDLGGEAIRPSMQLSIHMCSPTPDMPGTVTTTFTPLLGHTTSTPMNGPTQ